METGINFDEFSHPTEAKKIETENAINENFDGFTFWKTPVTVDVDFDDII